MKWLIIDKSKSKQPSGNQYNAPEWKEQIRNECNCQCIYCAINDAQFGGPRNFHVEHYKPKSIPRFHHLKLDISNLYYCCAICNTFKGDDWPNDWVMDDSEKISYPDPSILNYGDLFHTEHGYMLTGRTISGRYIINKLYLNRPQLIYERREYNLLDRYNSIKNELYRIVSDITKGDDDSYLKLKIYLSRLNDVTNTVDSLLNSKRFVKPYTTPEVSRP